MCRLHESLGRVEEELAREKREKEDLLVSAADRTASPSLVLGSPGSQSLEGRLRHDLEVLSLIRAP